MKTLTGKYNGETIYIHYVSKFLELVLVSREEDGIRKFKLNIAEVTDISEEDLFTMLREQELQEQLKKGGH